MKIISFIASLTCFYFIIVAWSVLTQATEGQTMVVAVFCGTLLGIYHGIADSAEEKGEDNGKNDRN